MALFGDALLSCWTRAGLRFFLEGSPSALEASCVDAAHGADWMGSIVWVTARGSHPRITGERAVAMHRPASTCEEWQEVDGKMVVKEGGPGG